MISYHIKTIAGLVTQLTTQYPHLSVSHQVIFEAEVSDGKAGFIAVDDIQVLSYPCGELLALQQLVLVGWPGCR